MAAWNHLDFDWYEYQQSFWFWLGVPGNPHLERRLFEAEEMISWSTCRDFRQVAISLKSSARALPPKPQHQTTLDFALNVGYGNLASSNPAVKVDMDARFFWDPPPQIWLKAPPEPKAVQGETFLQHVQRLRSERSQGRKNKAKTRRPARRR